MFPVNYPRQCRNFRSSLPCEVGRQRTNYSAKILYFISYSLLGAREYEGIPLCTHYVSPCETASVSLEKMFLLQTSYCNVYFYIKVPSVYHFVGDCGRSYAKLRQNDIPSTILLARGLGFLQFAIYPRVCKYYTLELEHKSRSGQYTNK